MQYFTLSMVLELGHIGCIQAHLELAILLLEHRVDKLALGILFASFHTQGSLPLCCDKLGQATRLEHELELLVLAAVLVDVTIERVDQRVLLHNFFLFTFFGGVSFFHQRLRPNLSWCSLPDPELLPFALGLGLGLGVFFSSVFLVLVCTFITLLPGFFIFPSFFLGVTMGVSSLFLSSTSLCVASSEISSAIAVGQKNELGSK